MDWPGCPLVIRNEAAALVCAHVGSGGDYRPNADDDLEDLINDGAPGDLRLEYLEPDEVAWLIAEDNGDLREACERVASAATPVAAELRAAISDLEPPFAEYEQRLARGPR